MRITDLEQYTTLLNEINILDQLIEKHEAKEKEIVADSVKDYSSGQGHNIVIRGYNAGVYGKILKTKKIRAERKKRLEAKALDIEVFIDTINDSEIRSLITLHYLEQYSWKVTARKVYGYPCEDRARKRVTRFFAEI